MQQLNMHTWWKVYVESEDCFSLCGSCNLFSGAIKILANSHFFHSSYTNSIPSKKQKPPKSLCFVQLIAD